MNEKHQRFVDEYLVDLNATKAAERAGYSPKTAYAQGCRLLKHAEVAAAVKKKKGARAERVEVEADDVLRELQHFAHADIGQAFDENGAMRALKDMPPEVRRAIASIEVLEQTVEGVVIGVIKKVKFWDKTSGLKLLGEHIALYTKKVEHSGGLHLKSDDAVDQLTTDEALALARKEIK